MRTTDIYFYASFNVFAILWNGFYLISWLFSFVVIALEFSRKGFPRFSKGENLRAFLLCEKENYPSSSLNLRERFYDVLQL